MGLNKLPVHIEKEMSDPGQKEEEEWRIWFPVASKVTNEEIEEIESKIGHKLPEDYKTFLKYKHFYDLSISEVSFCRHPVNVWRTKLLEMIFEGYPAEYLIDKGYIPFADWSDWGLLCFDTNRSKENKNYPIVLWDHEIAEEVQDQYKDFYDLIVNIDGEDIKNIN